MFMNIPGLDKVGGAGGMLDLLKDHINFPADKGQILQQVQNVPGIPDQAKDLIQSKLPDGTYNNIDEVKKAAGQ
jgi:hypothetical protein